MKRGMYSYRDFDQEKHYLYILGMIEGDYLVYGYDGEIVAWLHQYGLEHLLPTFEEGLSWYEKEANASSTDHSPSIFAPFTLSKHLPYLTYIPYWEASEIAPSTHHDFPLTVDCFHETGELHRLFTRFYSRHWWGRLPIEKRMQEMVNSFKDLLSAHTMGRVARYLFHKHVNDENRLLLLLHAGIYPYLTQHDTEE